MDESVAQKAVERTSKQFLSEIFPSAGKVMAAAAESIFSAIVRTGSTLVKNIACSMLDGQTSKKGLQEKVSGWLQRYDFSTGAKDFLWNDGKRLVGADTVIAIDSGDISKEFGGKGMEGMEMGYDASRGVTAMGHSLLCAAVVLRKRASALRLDLHKGRKGLPAKEKKLYDDIVKATGTNGILALDRGFDSEDFISHAFQSRHRTVVRVKTMTRDLFGTGRNIEKDMAGLPGVKAVLRSPTNRVEATIRWRAGLFPTGETHSPVLVVSSSFNGNTLYLYALNFADADASLDKLRKAAIAAANAYFCRWGVEVLFQDVKQYFSVEDARVRTFRRLENLLALCVLAYTYFAHVFPQSGQHYANTLKEMKDTLHEIAENFRPFVTNVRVLLALARTKFISGRPRKAKPPDNAQQFLPGFEPL